MATKEGWTSPAGLAKLKEILLQLVPQWPSGPHDWQIESTARILDGKNQFIVIACGGGKTAVSYLPILVLQKLSRDPSIPRFGIHVPNNPVVLFIGPLSDLSIVQVMEMQKMGIKAVTLESGTVRDAHEKEGRNLWKEVAACRHSIVILSPERLTHPELGTILRDEHFRKNIVALLLDEAHLIIPWGLDFRKSYADIPRLLARIPPDTPCAAVTATSCQGRNEEKLLALLNFRRGTFKETRQSNERPNVCKAYFTLTHGLEGPAYPDIAWVIKYKNKTIIYCRQIRTCARVVAYLRSFLPPGPARLHQIRQYHSLLVQSDNLDTLHAFETDPDVFCVVATIKFGMGLDARGVVFVVILGLPTTVETAKQEEGRAARDESMEGMTVTYVEKSIVSAIRKQVKKDSDDQLALVEEEADDIDEDAEDEGKASLVAGKKKQKIDPELKALVRCHVVRSCLVAEDNRIFGNAGTSTQLNCLLSQRRRPCSSCFFSLPLYVHLQKTSKMPLITSKNRSASTQTNQPVGSAVIVPEESPQKKYKPLNKSMKDRAEVQLWTFARLRWRMKKGQKFCILPLTALFSDGSIVTILSEFHQIRKQEDLAKLLADWDYLAEDGDELFDLIKSLNAVFDVEQEEIQRKSLEKRKATLEKKKADKQTKERPLVPTENTQTIATGISYNSELTSPSQGEHLAVHEGVENTPPSTPRKRGKRAAGEESSSGPGKRARR
ncbi:hypothetical protein NLI96_g7121 [Meripilus lineatus]|uniref:DNA 3'-5' helicase n=1 Tax=Meripilus lineatus TaxID=2056292 RepID=A0AAD5V1G9_9APHY|nr:hypothetical protein NLI96_g7121 [Physisporinus lineatus]